MTDAAAELARVVRELINELVASGPVFTISIAPTSQSRNYLSTCTTARSCR
jgi:hypothetical protein